MATKKVCIFCGSEYETDDKSVILFKSASSEDGSVRICSHCINKCHELYVNKMAKEKQATIKETFRRIRGIPKTNERISSGNC